ncbi:hypothetical protein N8T08_002308 [Aspergillus melleus]|uniref:Uncharacterized protein n=1 Tax=Aspergillus melleus TaxID=138277 RepID=A0ACC3B8N9_9EURO|nr:hypothetical protein N8T08_002308 [Aspergillus melleus]
MSLPSPQKNGGNNVPPPRQIRFVSTDGQPQTKRRRVNAACRTCRKRKIRCSGEQPVCKTCSDYNHVCLGYNDPPTHARSQSDAASRTPTLPSAPGPNEAVNSRGPVKVESRSPDSPQRATLPRDGAEKSTDGSRTADLKDASLTRDTSSRTTKESEQQTAGESPESSRTSLSSSSRTHVPYFRYFGPTAIVPGFKQMVVQVRGSRKSNPSLSSESLSPLRSPKLPDEGLSQFTSINDSRETRDANTIPFYDRDDSLPVSNLVTHLCDLFFMHLGCNFPFLQRDRFLRDLKDKKIDTMLVDAVCALSARFSPHPLLSPPQALPIDGSAPPPDTRKSDRGHSFARRAMSALVDSLSCPTLSVVQACLLLAYEEFGSNHDSGLWMYLGISIRMAQDLGLQKAQGLKYNYGQSGWFHTLIVLLHQPTLLNSFGGTIQHLYPNSRELSMSSAKTIADILSFSELVDGKSFIGNPFTSQPMYIAACAFLMESAHYVSPSSGSGSPPSQPLLANQTSGFVMPNMDPSGGSDRKPTAKHILLASAAKENYQRCYKALKALETYWEGTKYILTVLDQKAKGIVDPLLYTVEEMESAADIPSVQAFAASNWRRGGAIDPEGSGPAADPSLDGRRSPKIDPSQGATNSSQPNLSLLYQMPAVPVDSVPKPAYSSQYSHSYPPLPIQPSSSSGSGSFSRSLEQARTTSATPNPAMAAAPAKFSPLPSGRVSTSDANLLLGLNTSFSTSRPSPSQPTFPHNMPSSRLEPQSAPFNYNITSAHNEQHVSGEHMATRPEFHPTTAPHGDVMIGSQDIDMATLQQQDQLPFAFNGEILPWLEYLPQDVLNYLGEHQNYPSLMSPDDGTPRPPH